MKRDHFISGMISASKTRSRHTLMHITVN